MHYQIRPVLVQGAEDAYSEIEAVGAHEQGCLIMTPKAVHRVLKIRGLELKQAQIVKQEMLARGGDAAVAWGAVDASADKTDMLLMGNMGQFASLVKKLKQQPFGLPLLADDINRVLYHFEIRPFNKLNCRGRQLPLGERTLIMGILNVTPDSFSDGGCYLDPETAVERALAMVAEGADLIDVGGVSTRPGHTPVGLDDELARVVPVLERLAQAVKVPISVDTTKPEVAEKALDLGAHIINDQSALSHPRMARLAGQAGAAVIIMHHEDVTASQDLIGDITSFLNHRITERALPEPDEPERAYAPDEVRPIPNGLPWNQIIIDPGLGFGKTAAQNLEVLRRLRELKGLGLPILVGPSRKSMLGAVLDLPVEERLEGTAAAVTLGIANGADIVRVHDIKEMVRVAKVADAVTRGWNTGRG